MLPPFIIEQIRQREEQERARNDQAVLELELPMPPARPMPRTDRPMDDEPQRGIIILEL